MGDHQGVVRAGLVAGVLEAVERLRRHTRLPIAVGFGIRTPEQAAEIARVADAAVVGSAIVEKVAEGLDPKRRVGADSVDLALAQVRALARSVRNARVTAAAAG